VIYESRRKEKEEADAHRPVGGVDEDEPDPAIELVR
jgi:hypothetical protein